MVPSERRKCPETKRAGTPAGARAGDEDMRIILADAALEREGFRRRRA